MIGQLSLTPPAENIIIDGRSIYMTPLLQKDINETYLGWLNDPQINEFLEVRHKKQTFADIYSYVNGLRTVKGCEIFAIFSKSRNQHVGNLSVGNFDGKKAGYGVLIGDLKAQAMGVGGIAECMINEYIFSYMKAELIEVGFIAKHEKAWKTIESLGFKKVETVKDYYTLKDGEKSDRYTHILTRDEWNAIKGKFRILNYFNVTVADESKVV